MSFENVVLTYPHPHVVVYVEDNTVYTESFLAEEEPVKMIQCGAFASGRDNELLYCATYDEFISEYGEPNFRLYGQAGYNVARALKTGYAGAYVMRVMPEDAAYSNLVVMAKYKVIDVEGAGEDGESVKMLSLTFIGKTVENATTVEELEAAIDGMYTYDPDDDGSYTKPLFYVRQSGRGKYGNATRIKFSDATAYDDPETKYHSYRMDVLQMADTLTRQEFAYGSFNPDLFDTQSKESLYLEDLVNDIEEGLQKVRINIYDNVVEDILNMYNTEVAPDAPLTMSTVDILFGRNMDGTTNPLIVFETAADSIDLEATEGVSLSSGNDGSFDITKPDRDERIKECLVKAYNGEYDKSIKSRFSTPADFMLDANFEADVKRAMARLALTREYDAMCYLDTGMLITTADILAWAEEFSDIFGYNIVKEGHCYKVRDVDYTGKTIPVTTTYNLAKLIPTHFKTKGLGEPMVMENARITDAVKGSFLPVIDPDENSIKKEFYNARINYYETVRYGVYQRGVAITTQRETSDRLDEFNEYILHLAIKTAYDIMYSKLYKLAEEDDRSAYKKEADRVLQFTLGPLVRSVTVNFTMSADDERKNILRLVLRIVFLTIVKRGIVEVYLDPRA